MERPGHFDIVRVFEYITPAIIRIIIPDLAYYCNQLIPNTNQGGIDVVQK